MENEFFEYKGFVFDEEGKMVNYLLDNENVIIPGFVKIVYNSIVSGTEEYNVHIDINHPRKSTCTCPFAAGRRVICKHMVATFFTIYPEEAERIIKEEQEYEEVEERLFEEHLEEVKEYVNGLTDDEVRAALIDKLMDEWYDDDYRW